MAAQGREGGGGVAVLCGGGAVNAVDSSTSSSNGVLEKESTKQDSPILFFLFFHKAIRLELDALQRSALAYATGLLADIQPLLKRYRFLRSVYKHHCHAEDEVIFPALDIRVKNVARTYSLEHKGESDLFDHLFEILNSEKQNYESFPRELASCTGALQTSLSQHMSKEEEQVFPLLIEKFSTDEQASLVWQFLCSIPVNMMKKFLPWLSSSISPGENKDMQKCLSMIIPKEKLLQQVIFSWMEGGKCVAAVGGYDVDAELPCSLDSNSVTETCASENVKCVCESSSPGKRKFGLKCDTCDTDSGNPIDEVLHWHNAIKRELDEIAAEARRIELAGELSSLAPFYARLQFIAEVCIFHSIAEDKVIFPAVDGGLSFVQEHAEEESQFNELRCLIESIQSTEVNSTSAAEFFSKLCSQADLIIETIKRHFHNEEVQVLPLARKHFTQDRQRKLLYQSLCLMPLKLIEQVLPWLVGALSEDEARNFLKNLQLAASEADTALVTLLSGWACKGRTDGVCLSSSVTGCCHVKRFADIEECCARAPCPSLLLLLLTQASLSGRQIKISQPNHKVHPIDTIFKFHKAIQKDLEYLDVESGKLSDCPETFLRQFIGRFRLLWGLREKLFEDISSALTDLSELHEGLKEAYQKEFGRTIVESTGLYDRDHKRKYNELATKVQGMCKSIRDEQNKMMDNTLKQATRNTMFSEWLNECWRRNPEVSSQPEALQNRGLLLILIVSLCILLLGLQFSA
ncbi:hypothetical protein HAX54_013422 [Datura stramonium]|uniref:Hemerythrin-like domain-containing protein n=1 Tax=Datura stramonium TaxID=4076 RepID=A0ABS8RYB9_DATST|nr:hypothetical protein [Datura stramonium]